MIQSFSFWNFRALAWVLPLCYSLFSLKLIRQIVQNNIESETEYMEVHSTGNENKDLTSVIKNIIFRIFLSIVFTWLELCLIAKQKTIDILNLVRSLKLYLSAWLSDELKLRHFKAAISSVCIMSAVKTNRYGWNTFSRRNFLNQFTLQHKSWIVWYL